MNVWWLVKLVISKKKTDLLKDLKMLQEFYALLNFKLIMIDIIYKISVVIKITWIIWKIIFPNGFSRECNIILDFFFKKRLILFTTYEDKNSKLEKDKKMEDKMIEDIRNTFRLKTKMSLQLKMYEIFLD